MEKTFALINGSIVINHIVADNSFIEFISNDYDKIIETTDLKLKPSIGYVLLPDGSFEHPANIINSIEEDI